MKPTNLHKLATDLAESAMVMGWTYSTHSRLNIPYNKPGEFIKRRPKEEREQIKNLKSKHFNDRIDVI